MQKKWRLLAILAGFAMLFSFASCSNDDESSSDTSGGGLSISVADADKSITLSPGATKVISVTANGTFQASSSNAKITATASNSAKTVTIVAADSITEETNATVALTLNDDTSKKVTIAVKVDPNAEKVYDTMTLKLTFAEEIGAAKVKVEYWQGDDSTKTNGSETLESAVTNNTAKFTLSKKYANQWDWFNGAVTVFDANNADITDTVALGAFATDDTADITEAGGTCAKIWFKFTKDATITSACTKASAKVEETMTMTLNFAEGLNAKKVILSYWNADDSTKKAADQTETVTNNTVSFTLSNSYASDWGFNAKITVLNASEEDITTTIKNAYNDGGAGLGAGDDGSKMWFKFVKDATLTVTCTSASSYVYAKKTFTLSFSGFTLVGGKITGLKYATKWGSDTPDWDSAIEPEVTVAADGTNATFVVDEEKLDSSKHEFYVNFGTFKVVKSDETEQTISETSGQGNNGWYDFASATSFGATLTYTEQQGFGASWTQLYSAAFAGTGSFVSVVSVADMPKTITELYVALENMQGSSDWWFQINEDGSTWDNFKASWDESVSGYSITITDSAAIAKFIAGGIYAVTGSGISGTLTIKYK